MTRYEQIKDMTLEEMAKFLCDASECADCVAAKHCRRGHNGFNDWLKKEESDD